MSFAHLHVHSHYSILEGLGTPAAYVKRAQELGQTALALTDHGTMHGAIEFYKAAKKADIHPVIGVEFFQAIDTIEDRRAKIDNRAHNIVLLAENQKGYENLIQLITKGYLDGFYFRPRIDWRLMEEYSEGLICLTSDLKGVVAHNLLAGRQEQAKASLKRLQGIYGEESVFVELEDHPKIADQMQVNTLLVDLAKDLKAPLVVTNDVHYPSMDDAEAQDVLLCIKDNKHIDDAQRWKYLDDFSLKSEDEIKERFKDHTEAIENTMNIAERCKVDFEFGVNRIPHFDTPKKQSASEYLRELVSEGLKMRYDIQPSVEDIIAGKLEKMSDDEKKIYERMDFELNMIDEMGFSEYFLIVWDFIHYAKEQGIMVGPGRGSAAGAIIAYCLQITDLDPLAYDLLFERFLNPARVSMPDIDIDFQDDRREEVLEYVTKKYGQEKVAQVVTFGTLAAKAAVKDCGRVFGVNFQEMNQLSKLIPSRPGTKLDEALESEPELKQEYDSNGLFKKIYDTALKLEGNNRQTGVHACAVMISNDDLTKYTPLQRAPGGNEAIITHYSMKPLESLGLLKMDFLGLRNLTILGKAMEIIKRRHDVDIDLQKIPMDDQATFDMLADGKSIGVFQLESAGMRRYLKELKPNEFEDIIAMGALYRPGPMQFIPDYIAGKHGTREVKYVHDDLKPIIEPTYGIAVYQEQILQIAQKFAGFSLGEADLLRRAIGKKIAKELKAQREKFIEGGVEQGYSKKLATDIFDKVIEPFANYGFNKSHAACYGLISYQTAYLKAHYPADFMAALLSCDQENTDRVIIDIKECEEMGIKILPPSINESMEKFTVINDNAIRYGLTAIKGLGSDTIEKIVEAREEGPFKDLADLITRLPQKAVNKKSFEALIKSGALDEFAERNAMIQSMDIITSFAKQYSKDQNKGQTDLFGMLSEEHGEEHPMELNRAIVATWFQKLQMEKEVLGLYVSDHPLLGLREYMKRKVRLIGGLTVVHVGDEITVGGLLDDFRKITTKKGLMMCVFQLEDLTGTLPVVVFPRDYDKIKDADFLTDEGCFIMVKGKLDRRNGEMQMMAREVSKSSIQSMRENAMDQGVYNPDESRFADVDDETNTSTVPAESIATMPKVEHLVMSLRDSIKAEDLKKVKTILLQHPGDKAVTLNIMVEGRRKAIDTGLRVTEGKELQKEMAEYLEE
ncbi:MAG: DNA polymerase III subunit alpha [Candidatus Gracilibacteria bacterium]|nr:DNA polymerase III subunit alpha [Candidatus Gracilibacteria bacterium]